MVEEKLIPKLRFSGFDEEWIPYYLQDVIESFINGQTPSRNVDSYWNGDINWVSSGELNYNYITSTIEQITEEGKNKANLKLLPSGTFLMAITGLEASGTRGSCGILDIEATTNQSCMALIPKKDRLTTKFLYYWYLKVGEHYGLKYTQGTKQQSYNKELLEKLPIILPNIEEQNKITKFLSLINHKTKLLEEKHDTYQKFKKYLMQQIFEQKLMADETCDVVRLKNIVNYQNSKALEKFFNSERGYNVISIGNYSTDGKYINNNVFISKEVSEVKKYVLNKNDLAMVLNDKTKAGNIIGRCILIDEDDKYVYNQRTARLTPKIDINIYFLYQLINSPMVHKKIVGLSQGATQIYVNKDDLLNIQLPIPNRNKQNIIGNLFYNVNKMIDFTYLRINQMNQFKQSMFQQMFV